jgi:protein-tyrosine-phosphatase/predicted ATP-grasp superfamily ATP-dependent carboligase
VKPVLVLAGTARVVVSIARSLHRHGIEVDVAQSAVSRDTLASRAIRKVHRLPDFGRAEEFGPALQLLVEQCGYDTLIPTTDESLIAIAPSYAGLCKSLYPGSPAPEIVHSVLDKRLTLQAAREIGMDVPNEYQFRDLAELDASRGALRFPLLAKPASKVEEINFALHYYHSFGELREAFMNDPSFGYKYLLQEYCRGYGVGIELLIWDGKVHVVFQHKRLKELPSTGGVSIMAEAQLPDPRLVDAATRLLRRLAWQGAAMVEFRYDPATERAALMEINGRYWGSLPLSVNAGVEFPYYEWQLAHGVAPGPIASYAPGFRTLWRVGDLMRFTSIISRWRAGQETLSALGHEAWRLVADFCSATPDALWQWRDRAPAVAEFRDRILKRVFRPGIIAKVLPGRVVRELEVYRYYGLGIGLRYTGVELGHASGLSNRDLKKCLAGSTTFLFLCSGNIIRSPMAAYLFKQAMQDRFEIRVESAGLLAIPGRPADPTAVLAAREFGISLDDHRSRPLTGVMVDKSDVIFVMDHLNEAVLRDRFPRAIRKTFLLGECSSLAASRRSAVIEDPYGRGLAETRKCYLEIRDCVQALSTWLRSTIDEAGNLAG